MKRSTAFFVLVAKLYVRLRPRWGGLRNLKIVSGRIPGNLL